MKCHSLALICTKKQLTVVSSQLCAYEFVKPFLRIEAIPKLTNLKQKNHVAKYSNNNFKS